MTPATKQQKQRIAILVKGEKVLKEKLVSAMIGDANKTSTNDLNFTQANGVIACLGGKPLAYENWAFFDKNSASHRLVLSLAIQYGWTKNNRADLQKLSAWLKGEYPSGQSPVKKPLKEMTPPEVSRVIVALENMVKGKFK